MGLWTYECQSKYRKACGNCWHKFYFWNSRATRLTPHLTIVFKHSKASVFWLQNKKTFLRDRHGHSESCIWGRYPLVTVLLYWRRGTHWMQSSGVVPPGYSRCVSWGGVCLDTGLRGTPPGQYLDLARKDQCVGQRSKLKTLPSRHTTYANGN